VKVLRGPALPVLLTIAVAAASAAGVVVLQGHKAAAAAVKTAPVPLRGAAWTIDGAHDAPSMSELTGAWITDKTVVRGGVDGLHAYQRADGTSAWDLPVPVDGGAVCGMSTQTGDGIGVVSFSAVNDVAAANCTTVEGVDLATGKALWTSHTAGTHHLGLDGDVALMQSGTAKLVAVDAHSGAAKWTHASDSGCTEDSAGGFAAGGGVVLLADACAAGGDVVALSSADGHQLWKTAGPGTGSGSGSGSGAVSMAFVSASPAIVVDDANSPTQVTFFSAAGAKSAPHQISSSVFFLLPTVQTAPAAVASIGKSVICGGGRGATCWNIATGAPLPQSVTGDVIPVSDPGSDPRVITLPKAGSTHASVSRIGLDGKAVAEEELAKSVTEFLVKQGTGSIQAYGDAHDLVLFATTPDGGSAIVDVR
jgi:hypothetical protein